MRGVEKIIREKRSRSACGQFCDYEHAWASKQEARHWRAVMRSLCQLMAERNHPRSTAMTAQIKVPLRRPARPDTDHQVTQPGVSTS